MPLIRLAMLLLRLFTRFGRRGPRGMGRRRHPF
jgi:hypothetical protein